MKTKLLKSWLMLVMLLVGVGKGWATDVTFNPASDKSFPKDGITLSVTDGTLTNGTDYRVYKNQTMTISSTVGNITNIALTYSSASYDGGGWASSYQPNATSWTSPTANGEQARITKLVVTISSGGSTPTNYTVTVANNISNGTVTASPTSAKEGDEVTLTATPSTGYEFGEWKVTDASSNSITVTDNKFIMPAANVNVNATFNQIQGGDDTGDRIVFGSDWNKVFGTSYSGSFSTKTNALSLSGTVDDVTLSVVNGTSTNGYVAMSDFRAYNGYTLTFTAPTGYNIKGITSTVGGKNFTSGISANVGSLSISNNSINWTGSSENVILSCSGTVSFATLTVTIELAGDTPVADPQISNFIKTSTLNLLTNADPYDVRNCLNIPENYAERTEGAYNITTTINDLTQKDGEYACVYPYLSFQKAGSYTVKVTAAAIEGKYAETSGTITVTVTDPVVALTTMDEIFAKAQEVNGTETDVNVTLNNWVVSGVNGSNVYVTDGTKGFIIYKSGHNFVAGDILSGTVSAKIKYFNGSAEFTTITSATEGLTVTKGGSVAEQTIAIADLSGINTGALVTYEGLTYHLNGTSAEFSDGENVIVAYKGIMNALPDLVEGKTYDVKGIFLMYGTKKEILPRSAEDIVLKEIINNYTVSFAESLNGSIVVKAGETTLAGGAEVAEGTVLTIECTPVNADYRFKNWQYKEGEEAWATRTTDFTYTMPSANVQFRANFELIPTYTVAWSVDGKTVKSENVKEGAELVAPEVNSINGKVFTGWVETRTVDADATPTYVSPSAAADVTYYAVFATKDGEGSEGTIELTNENIGSIYDSKSTSYKQGTIGEWSFKAAINKIAETYYVQMNRETNNTKNAYNSHLSTPVCPAPIKSVTINTTNATASGRTFILTNSSNVGAATTDEEGVYGYGSLTEVAGTVTIDVNGNPTSLHIYPHGGAVYVSSVVVKYGTTASYSDFTTTPSNIPEEIGYETVDFTSIEPYKSINTGTSATVNGYDGHSFDMVFIPVNDSSTSQVKYIKTEENIKVIGNTKMTITADAPVKYIDFSWQEGYSDDKITVEGLGTTTVTVTFKAIARFTGFTVGYMDKVAEPTYTEKTLTLTAKGEMPTATELGEGGYPGYFATFSSDKDIFIPAMDDSYEFMTYVYTVFTDGVDLLLEDAEDAYVDEDEETELPGYYVPANNGVLLFVPLEDDTDASSITIPYYEIENVEVAPLSEYNMLYPASKDKSTLANHKFYKLAYSDSTMKPSSLGFYWGAANGAAFTSREGSAYLAVPAEISQNAAGFRFIEEDDNVATGISDVNVNTPANAIYNLNGQRVNASAKGIVIMNGKKMLNK